MHRLKAVAVGAGYFSRFHYEAWKRIAQVDLAACCDINQDRAVETQQRFSISRTYTDYCEMLDAERPDFVDIITRPETHLDLCRAAAERGVAIICQKPLAPTFDEARQIVQAAEEAGVRMMVHENFRFQPWHREIKQLIREGVIGDRLHSLTFRSRPGDGWDEDAYLGRQPYFRDMERLLIYETGIHFIDTFRFLAGPVRRVYCLLRKLNQLIAGEDCGLLVFEFDNNVVGIWDANRYNESNYEDPRYTFGEFLVEGNGGTIRLAMDATLTVQPLGQPETVHQYRHDRDDYGGGCCLATQQHFVDCMLRGDPFETDGREYLNNLVVQEAMYESAQSGQPVDVQYEVN